MEGDTNTRGAQERGNIRVFKSRHHPDGRSRAAVYGRALVRPLAAGMLPLMIITLMAFLEGHPALVYFLTGAGIVIILSSVWTSFQLKRIPAAIYVSDASAAVLTVFDVLDAKLQGGWAPVFDLRDRSHAITVTIGYAAQTFEAQDWPHFEEMTEALIQARENTFKDLSRLHRERQKV